MTYAEEIACILSHTATAIVERVSTPYGKDVLS